MAVLLVEDEALVAMDLESILEDEGATVIGPARSLADAMRLATMEDADVAILDVDLRGEDVFPAADILSARKIPFLFHTGHGAGWRLSESYPDAPVCRKPATNSTIFGALKAIL